MEKIDFTPQQKIIVSAFAKEPRLTKHFYFTGGTALSVFYLGHRLSDDVDFNYYPFRRLKESKIVNGIEIDNIKDIAINKLISINQRTEITDYCF